MASRDALFSVGALFNIAGSSNARGLPTEASLSVYTACQMYDVRL